MGPGLIHSRDCLVGTSHNVPADCKDAEFKSIRYPAPAPEPEIGPTEPETNSEEGRKAVEAAAQADQDITDAVEASLAKWRPNPDPDGYLDVIPGAEAL